MISIQQISRNQINAAPDARSSPRPQKREASWTAVVLYRLETLWNRHGAFALSGWVTDDPRRQRTGALQDLADPTAAKPVIPLFRADTEDQILARDFDFLLNPESGRRAAVPVKPGFAAFKLQAGGAVYALLPIRRGDPVSGRMVLAKEVLR